MKFNRNLLFCIATSCFASTVFAADKKVNAPAEYLQWLDNLKQEMIERGISKKTIKKVYKHNDYYHPDPEVVKIDRKQIEFVLTATEYLNRVVNENRVKAARQKYRELYPQFRELEEKYGVPFNYLAAFWGVETNFGQNFGKHQLMDVLTTLSYDTRRPKFFKEELYQALKIVDEQGIAPEEMESSWAGAMGHFQFMPSTFNAYAVDYNQDGQVNIWSSFEDAAASAANYLSSAGWTRNQPWGAEVSLPWNFDYAATGRDIQKSIRDWKQIGIKTAEGLDLPFDETMKASIIVPEGRKGSAFLMFDNFRVIMKWNRSENYALAVGMLADYIISDKKYQKRELNPAVVLKTDDVLKVQSFINKQGWAKLDEDGQLGQRTRAAVKQLQKKARLPQDGYPDYRLLLKISRYHPSEGFSVPVPPRKLHK
ncbi:MAG: lytic murein transglycosylase [Alphaproteobacteria bacterium]|nr:lytic murein transglycosylase [Alphaproteobacteria bacterium]